MCPEGAGKVAFVAADTLHFNSGREEYQRGPTIYQELILSY
jgi:hypothetical protein